MLQNKVWVDSRGTRLRTFQFLEFNFVGQITGVGQFRGESRKSRAKIFWTRNTILKILSETRSNKFARISRDSVLFLHRLDNFMTSDTLKNRRCNKMDTNNDLIIKNAIFLRKEIFNKERLGFRFLERSVQIDDVMIKSQRHDS